MNLFKRLFKEESGQDLIEYVLIAAMISVAAIAGSSTLVTNIVAEWDKIAGYLT